MQLSATISISVSTYLEHAKAVNSLSQYNAKAQALSSLTAYLHSAHRLPPTSTIISQLQPIHLTGFLEHLQTTRSIETEHLYIRAIADYLNSILQTIDPQLQPAIHQSVDYLQLHRRPRPHTIQETPIAAINELLVAAHTLSLPGEILPTDRRYLQSLRDRAIIYMLADTGLRPSEICALRIKDLSQHSVTVDATTICMTPQTDAYLRQYLRARQAAPAKTVTIEPLFARHDKRASGKLLPISRWTLANIITNIVDTYLSAATKHELLSQRMSLSPITFRHFFVISTLMSTNNVSATAARARHKDPATTRQYIPQSSRIRE